jgi:mannose-1-phosphate guanylyltransferase
MLIPVILSGGTGSRLWPVSREAHPKPFLRLADGQSLLQKTFLRAAALTGVESVLTVTNRELYFKSEDEYRQVNQAALPLEFILEPLARNTAGAVAAAALHTAQTHGGETLMLVLAADHLIADEAAFAHAVETACELAEQDWLVTFGIRPDYPETGFGYIEAEAEQLATHSDQAAHRVHQFVEKPPLERAQEYLASGRHFWNAGLFCFKAKTLIDEMRQHAPEVMSRIETAMQRAQQTTGTGLRVNEISMDDFAAVPDISLDYALMERSKRVAVVPCDIGWNDIGSWNALSSLVEADPQGNRVAGEALLHDSRDCYIHSPDRLTATVGVDKLIIVDTPDALLIAHRDRAQDVKSIVQKLKLQGHDAHRLHRTVHRPWGSYTVLEEGERFKMKRIEVKPGAKLSLQMHHHRSEHWIVVNGMARVTNGDKVFLLNTNESTFIPAGHVHRLENPGVIDLVMIEVQSGDYLGEDDIVRLEDTYGRV